MKLIHALLLQLSGDDLRDLASRLMIKVDANVTVDELTSLVMRHESVTPLTVLASMTAAQMRLACAQLRMSTDGDAVQLRDRLLDQAAAEETGFGDAPAVLEHANHPLGALVRWPAQGLVGVVSEVLSRRIHVRFDNGDENDFVVPTGALERVSLEAGSRVVRAGSDMIGVVLQSVAGQSLPTWEVSFPDSTAKIAESGLRRATLRDPVSRMRSGLLESADAFNLRVVAAEYWIAHHHNELVSLGASRVELMPHQVFVAHKVVEGYPHRFLLCDEVGLGKTIEAGVIIKELRARGQAKRVLVLVPPGLMGQWQFELKTKFNESFAIYVKGTYDYLKNKGVPNPWMENDSIITSHTWASYTENRIEEIAHAPWDLVVVDEAHHARIKRSGNSSKRTNLYKLVEELIARPDFVRRGALLLTATPLQLERHELYALVEMMNPVLFASEQAFVEHITRLGDLNRAVSDLETKGKPRDADELDELANQLAFYLDLDPGAARVVVDDESSERIANMLKAQHRLSEVMIRNRKAVVGGFQPRKAFRWEVTLSEAELEIHRLMDEVLDEGFALAAATRQNAVGFLMVILQKLLASSSRALLSSLRKRMEGIEVNNVVVDSRSAEEAIESDIESATVVGSLKISNLPADNLLRVIRLLEEIPLDSKAAVFLEKLTELFEEEPSAKVVVFTEFRETQNMLQDLAAGRGWGAHSFHGQLRPEAKDRAIANFREGTGPQILVSTEAGGEGRNFQFAHHIVNYDLPWNPMKIEQRIGRLDRIGQEHPVTIFNFHVEGTIEGRILDVLERRIRIFEEAVGGLDPILGEAEPSIRKAIRLTRTERDRAMERLGEQLEHRVEDARRAEDQIRDFILENNSYKAEIARTVSGVAAPIQQHEFELFLERLMRSAGTYLDSKLPSGERKVVFHAPFTTEHKELFGPQSEVRRICMDPRLLIDSQFVEYFGFGHPIADALVTRTLEERPDGAAAVRAISPSMLPLHQSGWLFVYILEIGGMRTHKEVAPVFVGDDGAVDEQLGGELLRLSRLFEVEASDLQPDPGPLDAAQPAAEVAVGRTRDRLLEKASLGAGQHAQIAEERTKAVFEQRRRAADDRIASCAATLERLERATSDDVRRAAPMWEANLARAQAEREQLERDLEEQVRDIRKRSLPSAEYSLLAVARVVQAGG